MKLSRKQFNRLLPYYRLSCLDKITCTFDGIYTIEVRKNFLGKMIGSLGGLALIPKVGLIYAMLPWYNIPWACIKITSTSRPFNSLQRIRYEQEGKTEMDQGEE